MPHLQRNNRSRPRTVALVSTRRRVWKKSTVEETRDFPHAVGYVELDYYEAMRGGRRLVRYRDREVLLSVPSGAQDGQQIPVEGDAGAVVVLRVRPKPLDSRLVRATAAAGLLAAVGFLVFLFLR